MDLVQVNTDLGEVKPKLSDLNKVKNRFIYPPHGGPI